MSKEMYLQKIFIIILINIITIAGFLSGNSDHAKAGNSAQKSDYVKYPSFDRYGSAVSDTENVYICVKTKESIFIYWNPVDNSIKSPSASHCEKYDGFQPGPMMINTTYSKMHNNHQWPDIHLDGSGIITCKSESYSNLCHENFLDLYSVLYENKDHKNFYVIVHQKNLSYHMIADYCDGSGGKKQELKQVFDSTLIFAVSLPNGFTLLSDSSNNFAIGLRRVPSEVVAFGNNIFVVPEEILKPVLEKAGYDLKARYRAVMDVLKSPAIHIN